ncbi:MAG: hypothetical protein AAFQ61_11320 [Cyanobacteria bacterium J06626_23]
MDGNFWIWAGFIVMIFAFGGGAIAVTTLNPLGARVPFTAPVIELSTPLSPDALTQFELGVQAFQASRHADAVDEFNRVIAQEPSCAEAFHNRALAQANLGKLNFAIPDFLRANELYDQQGTKSGVEAVMVALETLSQRGDRARGSEGRLAE